MKTAFTRKALLPLAITAALLAGCGPQQSQSPQQSNAPATVVTQSESDKANALFEQIFMDEVRRDPVRQTRLGIKDDYDKWQDLSDEHYQAGLALTQQHLTMLQAIDIEQLDSNSRVSYLLMQQELQQTLDDAKWRLYSYPVNQMFGTHSQVPSLLINQHTISDESDAKAFAASLTDDAMDVAVYPVLAYSTLGWMNWAGGDPLLNTFIAYPEGELARILFHELAHQVVYVADDTAFNESFATAVERLGGARWLTQAGEKAQREYAAFDARRQAFRALTRDTREHLQAIFEDVNTTADQKRQLKAGEMTRFHARFAEMRQHWNGYRGYDAWVARANNASFGAQAAYDDLVPGFEALFEREGRDFARFYDAVRALAKLPPQARLAHRPPQRLNQPKRPLEPCWPTFSNACC